jgi:hypothetical protein
MALAISPASWCVQHRQALGTVRYSRVDELQMLAAQYGTSRHSRRFAFLEELGDGFHIISELLGVVAPQHDLRFKDHLGGLPSPSEKRKGRMRVRPSENIFSQP